MLGIRVCNDWVHWGPVVHARHSGGIWRGVEVATRSRGIPGAVLTPRQLIGKRQHYNPTSRIYDVKRPKQTNELTYESAFKEIPYDKTAITERSNMLVKETCNLLATVRASMNGVDIVSPCIR